MTTMTSTMPLVSIVLPIYNAGPEIEETFTALRALDYPAAELIFVDDASQDGSGDALDRFAESDERVRVVHLEQNVGAAEARNIGLRHAGGEYVWFVDWDDQWNTRILRRLVDEAVTEDADVVVCTGVWRLSSGLDIGVTDGTGTRVVVDGAGATDLLLQDRLRGYLWNKLVRRTCLPDDPFPRITTQEDLCAVANLLPRTRKVVCIPDRLYFHVVREGSLSNTRGPALTNFDVSRSAVHAAAASLPPTVRRQRMLRDWDVAWYASRAGTAIKLSDADSARAALRDLREGLPVRDIVAAAPGAPKTAAKAMSMKVLGPGYMGLRTAVVGARDGLRARRGRPRAAALPTPARVLIRTLPLRRGNYGGVLQAVALQHVVRDLGFDVTTDASEKTPLVSTAKKVVSRVLSTVTRRPVGFDARARVLNAQIDAFTARTLSTTHLYMVGARVPRRRAESYAAMITGSDQVWRAEYGDFASYLFDFLDDTSRVRRIAYAASFGTATPDVDSAHLRSLAGRFHAISVREEQAVATVDSAWGVTAVRMPDPTFLLERAAYDRLVPTAPAGSTPPGATFAYVLDSSAGVVDLLERLPEVLGAPLHTLAVPTASAASGLSPRPSVEQWIASIRDADAVITDSFHGTVFALIFNRPFVAVGNARRGMARFEALLERFGLTDHLVQTGDDGADHAERVAEALRREIDWDAVNRTIRDERERGLGFLRAELSGLSS